MNIHRIVFGFCLCGLSILFSKAHAQEIDLHTFERGKKPTAEQFNENFRLLANEIRKLQSRTAKSFLKRGTVVFVTDQKCPSTDWRPLPNAGGRYVVATHNGGTVSAAVGKPLNDQEERSVGWHTHNLDGDGLHTHAVLESGAHDHSYRTTDNGDLYDNRSNIPDGMDRFGVIGAKTTSNSGNHVHGTDNGVRHSHTVKGEGDVKGTPAPYIQLLACELIGE